MTFEYSNLNDRTPGWLFRLVRRLLPGVGLVESEIKPYAAAWSERNLEALASGDPLWVVLGDSMSLGIGASSIDQGWVPRAQLPALAGLSAVPDLITVLIGSNDIISQVVRETPNSAAKVAI